MEMEDVHRNRIIWNAFKKALKEISENGVDTGCCEGQSDFWMTIDGVEFIVTVRRSNNQIMKDSKH